MTSRRRRRREPHRGSSRGRFCSCVPPMTYSTSLRNPLTMGKQQDDDPHDQVTEDQGDERAIAEGPVPGALENGLAMRAHRLAIDEARDIGGELARVRVSRLAIGGHALLDDRR